MVEAERTPDAQPRVDFTELLRQAVSVPGKVHQAYSAFHGYSIGNQMLALCQCVERGIAPGPMTTFPGWKAKGRHVKKGAKAIWLWQPITVTKQEFDDADPETFTRFIFRNRWFVYAQTEGQDLPAVTVSEWDRAKALAALNVQEVPFSLTDGNVQGFARGRSIAISPVAAMPAKTTFHELGHVLLGHTGQGDTSDASDLPRNLREVEAEGVALLCLESLGLPGAEYARGYIQHWLGSGQVIPERSAQRIFKTADAILRAGRHDDGGQS